MTWVAGDQVQVSLPYGMEGGKTVHLAVIERVREPGPVQAHPHRTVFVRFDDPAVYGGFGAAWVGPDVLAKPGDEPADAEGNV